MRQVAQRDDEKVEGDQVEGGQEGDEGVAKVVAQNEDQDVIDPTQGGGGSSSYRRLAVPKGNSAGGG